LEREYRERRHQRPLNDRKGRLDKHVVGHRNDAPADTNAFAQLVRQAIGGNRDALDRLVRSLQGDVYDLALRMLWNREDAEDATQ
jgi:hypothetical protein